MKQHSQSQSQSQHKKKKSFSGVAPSSGDIDRHLTSFECHEISRLYKHLINVTKGDSSLAPDKFELAASSLSSLLKKLSPIRSLNIQAADDVTLHVFSLGPFTSLNELILNRVPPSTVEDIYSFRQRIHRLEVINSGIPELRKFLAPIKRKYWAHFKPMHIGISPSLHHVFPEYKDDSEHPSRSQSIDKNGALVTTGDDEADAYLKNCWLELTHLRLCNCGIARLDPSLHFLPHLKMLDLSHNDLSNVIHLHDCPNLTMLNLAHNRIRVLSNLSLVVGGIQRLNLSHNEISMLDGIENLRHLTKLDLSHNLIDDIGEVDHLVGLEELQELFLSGNPLAASRHTAGVSTAQEQHYRCEVFGCFMHDCSIQQRPLPLLDGTEMSVDEELKIKSSLFLPPDTMTEEIPLGDGSASFNQQDFQDVVVAYNEGFGGRSVSVASPFGRSRPPSFLSPSRSQSSSFSSQPPLFSPSGAHHIRDVGSVDHIPVVLLNKTFQASSGNGDSLGQSPPVSSVSSIAEGSDIGSRPRLVLTTPQRKALLDKSVSRFAPSENSADRKDYFRMILMERKRLSANHLLQCRRHAEIVDDPVLGQEFDHEFEAQIRRNVRVWDNASPKKKGPSSHNNLSDHDDGTSVFSGSFNNSNCSSIETLSNMLESSHIGSSTQHKLMCREDVATIDSPAFGTVGSEDSTNSAGNDDLNNKMHVLMSEEDEVVDDSHDGSVDDIDINEGYSRHYNSKHENATQTKRSNVRGVSALDENDILAVMHTNEITPTRESRSNARGISAMDEGALVSAFHKGDEIDSDEEKSDVEHDHDKCKVEGASIDVGCEVGSSSSTQECVDDPGLSDIQSSDVGDFESRLSIIIEEESSMTRLSQEELHHLPILNHNETVTSSQCEKDSLVESASTADKNVEDTLREINTVDESSNLHCVSEATDVISNDEVKSTESNIDDVFDISSEGDTHHHCLDEDLIEEDDQNEDEEEKEVESGNDVKFDETVKEGVLDLTDNGGEILNDEIVQGTGTETETEIENLTELEGEHERIERGDRDEQIHLMDKIDESSTVISNNLGEQKDTDLETSGKVTDQPHSSEDCVTDKATEVHTDTVEETSDKQNVDIQQQETIEEHDEEDDNDIKYHCKTEHLNDEVVEVTDESINITEFPNSSISDVQHNHDNFLTNSEKDDCRLPKSLIIGNQHLQENDCVAISEKNDISHEEIDPGDVTQLAESVECDEVHNEASISVDSCSVSLATTTLNSDMNTLDSPTTTLCDKDDSSRISESSSLFTINERPSYLQGSPRQDIDIRHTMSSISSGSTYTSPVKSCNQMSFNNLENDSIGVTNGDNIDTVLASESTIDIREEIQIDSPDIMSNENALRYTGPTEFEQLSVMDNLETYFKVQVFGHDRPSGASPYMYYHVSKHGTSTPLTATDGKSDNSADQFIASPIRPERVLGFYYEEVIESEHSDQLLPMFRDSIGGSDEAMTGQVKRLIFVLTDIHMYVVRDDFATGATFADAPVPYLHRLHALETLRSCTLYFGFQRCSLHFHDMDMDLPPTSSPSPTINWRKQGHKNPFGSPTKGTNAAGRGVSSSMAVFVYMILTKDKSRTHPVVTTVLPAANRLRVPEDFVDEDTDRSSDCPPPALLTRTRALPKVEIRNKDSQFLDQVALLVHTHDTLRGKSSAAGGGKRKAKTKNQNIVINPSSEESYDSTSHQHVEAVDVVHAQLLSQVWRKKPNYSEPRTLVITPSFFLLCAEALDKEDVHLTLLDRVAIKDVHKMLPDDDPLAFTLVLSGSAANSSNKVTRSFVTRKWRLRCSSRSQQAKSTEECRRVCKDMGNNI